MVPSSLTQLMQSTGMWRASHLDDANRPGNPTGYVELDQRLAGGGWPEDGLTELLHNSIGIGEMRLVGPALAHLSESETRWIVWVAPPFIPYAPGLSAMGIDLRNVLIVRPKERRDILWVIEQALASTSCSAVLAWEKSLDPRDLRRLNLASREGRTWGVLFRPTHAEQDASPAELRLSLEGSKHSDHAPHRAIDVRIIKRRGGCATDSFRVNLLDSLDQSALNLDYCDLPFEAPTSTAEHSSLTLIEDSAETLRGSLRRLEQGRPGLR